MEGTTNDRKYECNICNEIFTLKSALSRHKRIHHTKRKDKQVGFNAYKSFLKQLRMRQRLHDNFKNAGNHEINNTARQTKKVSELYKNIISETIYSSDSDCEYALIQTIIKIDPNKNSSSECKYCKKKFTKSDSLNRHLIKHIKDLNTPSDNITPPVIENQNLEPTNPELISNNFVQEPIEISKLTETKALIYSCQECNKTFKYACNLTNHQKYHLKQSSVLNVRHVSNLNGKFGRLRFSCSYCNKVYSKRLHLENHEIVHKDENIEINNCVGEKVNVKNTHLCMFCGKKFTKSSHLSVHIKIHLNDKSHLCSFCGKSFTLKRYLEIHQRTHTRERPFTCEQCQKGFIHKSSLVEHLRIHTGIKPHICSFCGKKFTHYSGLTQHLRTHTDDKEFVCGICGKAFRFGGHYREHIRIHSGDKPYNCGSCNRSFTSRSSLVVHLRIHSGERPYQCMACKKGFIKSYGLTQHRKTHTACNSMYENKNTT